MINSTIAVFAVIVAAVLLMFSMKVAFAALIHYLDSGGKSEHASERMFVLGKELLKIGVVGVQIVLGYAYTADISAAGFLTLMFFNLVLIVNGIALIFSANAKGG